jgi:glycerol-3-phosphate O-acyltransferase / dihydroxyacetone phosphate acyltransferase
MKHTGFACVLVKWLVSLVVRIFFQDVQLVGESNLPRKGPVILVGNHQNQFVDALVLFSQCSRDVQFLIAAKSLSKPVVGTLARSLRCIPVQRRIDAARSVCV